MIVASVLELLGIGFVILVINSFLGLSSSFPIFVEKIIGIFLIVEENNITRILIFILIFFTLKLLLLIFISWKENIILANFREEISNKLYHNFLNRDLFTLLKKNSAVYLRNFTDEINMSILYIMSFTQIILNAILLIVFLIFLLFFNPIITLSVFLFFGSVGGLYFLGVKNKLSDWATEGLSNRKKRIQYINESFLAIKSIKILSRENFFFQKVSQLNQIFSKLVFKVNFLKSLPTNFFEYFLFLSMIMLFYFLFISNYSNEKIIQILSVYLISAFRLIPIINKILGFSQSLKYSYKSIEKLAIENKHKIYKKGKTINNFPFKKNISIKIKKFNFENTSKSLFKNISLNIKKKSKIGIIGKSGSGKSTLIDIICGFRNFDGCNLKIDGKEVQDNLEGWQNNIGFVPQNIIILNENLRNNLLFGASKKKFSDNYLKNLINKVDLKYFFKKNKLGLSQKIRQDGQNISGGEKQRIGIARALINNPEVIILDEATSGLDSFTENNVLNTIRKLKKTTIIVSHRISALKFCDKIFEVKNNTLKEIKKSKMKNIL